MKRLASILPLLVLFGCSASSDEEDGNDKADLPYTFENLVIRLSDGGGMLDLSKAIYISKDSSSWNYRRNGNEKCIAFETTDEELKGLYDVIRTNEFNKIETRSEGEVYDRGGIDIDITIDNKSYTINNSGSYFIEEDWSDNWAHVSIAILEHAATKTEDKKFKCRVFLDEEILALEYPFRVGIDGKTVFDSDEEDLALYDLSKGFFTMTLSGPTEVNAELYYPDSTGQYGEKISYAWGYGTANYTPENNGVTFYLEDKELKLKEE